MWQEFVDLLVYGWFGMPKDDACAKAVNFFIYDGIKIMAMLGVIIFFVTLLRSWFNTEKVRDYLAGKHPLAGHTAAAMFGIVTPFCSCSAVPLFLGFMQARIPVGVAFSFLISAPMNNEIAIGMLLVLFGWKIAALYVGFGLVVAILGGILLGWLRAERWVLLKVEPLSKPSCASSSGNFGGFKQRAAHAYDYSLDIIKKVWLWVLAGVAVGAFVHGFMPTDLVVKIAGPDNLFAVPLAVMMGVPVYANCAGAMPLVIPMVEKGMAMGTALAFMMSVTALSLPEAIILKRILHTKLILLFFGIVAVNIMVVGYLFNIIL